MFMKVFYVIGAQKSGTTWLYSAMRRHPLISFPFKKEAHYWDGVEAGERGRAHNEYHAKLTAVDQPERRCAFHGDMTPAYAILSVETISEIKLMLPDLKIVFLVRKPAQRAWSAAKMFLKRAGFTDVSRLSKAWLFDLCTSQPLVNKSDYALTIDRWTSVFGDKSIFLHTFDKLQQSPQLFYKHILNDMGLETTSGFKGDFDNSIFTEMRHVGAAWDPPRGLMRDLEEYYDKYVLQFKTLLSKVHIRREDTQYIETWQ